MIHGWQNARTMGDVSVQYWKLLFVKCMNNGDVSIDYRKLSFILAGYFIFFNLHFSFLVHDRK